MTDFVGPYRVIRPLGRGGLGSVFLARPTAGGDEVALKVLPLSAAAAAGTASAQELRRRFLVEAGAARLPWHPHVVSISDVGEEGGRGWIAMELVVGTDLTRYTHPSRLLPCPVVAQIGACVAAALAHAHAAGVVHRDVKPSNILTNLPAGIVKLGDFGVARTTDATATVTGLFVGTPTHLAPEVLAGNTPTTATDLYALGATLFELLCGRLPFEAATMGELLQQVAQAPVPDIAAWADECPPALSTLVTQLLAKQASLRPHDAAEVARRLQAMAAATRPVSPATAPGPKSRER